MNAKRNNKLPEWQNQIGGNFVNNPDLLIPSLFFPPAQPSPQKPPSRWSYFSFSLSHTLKKNTTILSPQSSIPNTSLLLLLFSSHLNQAFLVSIFPLKLRFCACLLASIAIAPLRSVDMHSMNGVLVSRASLSLAFIAERERGRGKRRER